MAGFSSKDFEGSVSQIRTRDPFGLDGWFVCKFINQYGILDEAHGVGRTPQEAIENAIRYIGKHGGKPLSSSSGKRGNYRPRSPIHSAQWGRPTNKQLDYKRSLEQIFGEIRARAIMGSTAAASATNLIITEDIAKELLQNIYNSRGKYNTYTGNLERAYKASIIMGRKSKASVYLDKTPAGNEPVPHPKSKRGKLIVYMYGNAKHRTRKIKQNQYRAWKRKRKHLGEKEYERVPYRYFRSYELKKGYRNKGWVSGNQGKMPGFAYSAFGGGAKGTVQSGIVFENTAPYAGAVEHYGYQVMPIGAMKRSYNMRISGKKKTLSLNITKNMLKAAGLIK